ncbi:restriction endonuclease subunit S [Helicobacter pylori]|nr:restriction endonuclease subunit S [Helicobacter pylori]
MDALTTPSNWQRVRLGDICEIVKGQQINKISLNNTDKYPVINGGIDFLGYTNKFNVSKNTIAISEGGTCGYVRFMKSDFWSGGHNYSLQKISNKVNNLCLYHILKSYEKDIMKLGVGSGLKNIQLKALKDLLIPLPPLNEQIAIANVLSDVDRYLYSLDALILKKESVKKALSFELLSQRKRLKGFNQAWQKVKLGDMTTSFTKQTGFDYSASIKPTLIKEQLPNYIPFIQNKDFSGHYINYKTDYFIPNEIAIRFPQILLNEKCLLISISGAIGNVAVFNHSQDAFIGGAIAVLKFKEKKSLDFVMHFLMSASGQKLLLNSVKSSSHKNLTIADLRDLLIPLPPLNEQIAIANILSALDHEIISLKNKKRQFDNIKKALNHDLMSAKIRVLNK